jgi:hypothetical protein
LRTLAPTGFEERTYNEAPVPPAQLWCPGPWVRHLTDPDPCSEPKGGQQSDIT